MFFIIKGEVAVTFPTSVETQNSGKGTGFIDVLTNATNMKREISVIHGSQRGRTLSSRQINEDTSARGSRRGSICSRRSNTSRLSQTKGHLLHYRTGTYLSKKSSLKKSSVESKPNPINDKIKELTNLLDGFLENNNANQR